SKILKQADKADKLKADYLMIVDVSMKDAETPAITLGIRGLCAFTVELKGSNSDLHSGIYGGIVYNPLHALVEMLASLRDSNGRITIPGFYNQVSTPSEEELSCISFDFDQDQLKKDFNASSTGGEKNLSPLERSWLRPTLEINGITGGYGGPGTKTVIAAQAQAKLSCRLVPNQDPRQITQLIKNYIESLAPKGIEVNCTIHEGMGKPVRTSPSSKLVKALAASCGKVYSQPAAYIYDGATIPIATELQEASQSEVVFFGLALPTDKIHAPNECFGWDRIRNGFLILCDALSQL
ncbi:MAG: M20/M25/M40 family metallo-hydrolase, partial [Verrucomicrobia bacterium]|nr:M20/M25/M40 family metallo-hydrolase [Verrucomicrobiota bacterium]